MKQVYLQPAFVLHTRAYRETSLLIELFTPEYGRLSVLAKGVRKPKSSTSGLLQPFIPLLVSWTGKQELMTLTHVELHGRLLRLQGECLFAGFYLNELLLCLFQKWDAYPGLYKTYQQTLTALQSPALNQSVLRSFEKRLLEELGYGLLPPTANFLPEQYYRFVPELGFVESDLGTFLGKNLLAIAREEWQSEDVLQDAKRLTRCLLAPLLGKKEINSRKLFLKVETNAVYNSQKMTVEE